MNPNLGALQPYPFQRFKELCADLTAADQYPPIDMSIGEPKHQPPQFVLDTLKENLSGVVKYPPTPGSAALRTAIAQWIESRFSLPAGSVTAEGHVLPVNGTPRSTVCDLLNACLIRHQRKRWC